MLTTPTTAAHIAANLPPLDIEAIAAWFSGAMLKRFRDEIVPMLDECERIGGWAPKTSRKVRAIFDKSSKAKKIAWGFQENWEKNYSDQNYKWFWGVAHCMVYGAGKGTLPAKALPSQAVIAANGAEALCAAWKSWRTAFEPLIERIAIWDTRPVYRAIPGHSSATVAKTLADAGLPQSLDTLRLPPIEYRVEKIVEVLPSGVREVEVTVGYIAWPANVVHNGSRFSHNHSKNRSGNDQCHACGHAIKNSHNWVPLLVDDAKGVPHSLWVGHDCGRNLFGVAVDNGGRFAERLGGIKK